MIQAHNTDTNILKHHSCQYKYSGTLKRFSTSVIEVSCSKYPFSFTKPMSQSLIWNVPNITKPVSQHMHFPCCVVLCFSTLVILSLHSCVSLWNFSFLPNSFCSHWSFWAFSILKKKVTYRSTAIIIIIYKYKW